MSRYGDYEDRAFIAELYDLVPAYVSRGDVDFYMQIGRLSPGKVLELGCGTGRVLIPIATAGVEITGLDLSPYMLAKCQEKVQAQPQAVQDRIRLVQASMTDFHLEDTFSTAIIPFRPFQHLIAVEDQLACLSCINAHLEKGGRLIFDCFHLDFTRLSGPDLTQEREDTPEFTLPDGRRLRRCNRLVATHRADQVNDVEIIFYLTHADGSTERLVQAFPFRYYFRYEVEHLLARCGFHLVELFGNFDRSPLEDDSPEMIFVAEKIGS